MIDRTHNCITLSDAVITKYCIMILLVMPHILEKLASFACFVYRTLLPVGTCILYIIIFHNKKPLKLTKAVNSTMERAPSTARNWI